MNKLIVFAASALGTAVTQQAIACDFQREANYTAVIVADGGGSCTTCAIERPTTDGPTQPTVQEPKQKNADRPAPPGTDDRGGRRQLFQLLTT